LNSFNENNEVCWPFSEADPIPFAVISAEIKNSLTSEKFSLDCKVDTGFNGVIGLPNSFIKKLDLPEAGKLKIQTASGVTFTPYFNGIISIKSTELQDIKAIILKTPRPLVGRTLLNLGTWLYDGVNKKYCKI